MDRFHALTAFARVVETGSFARAAERLGVSVSSVSRARRRPRGAPRRAASEPDDAPALAHRNRAGVLRALRAAARGSRGSRSRGLVGVDRAARHVAPHLLGDFRLPPSRPRDRRVLRAPSADALRRRALRARRRHRRGGLRPRRPRRRHRQSESRRPADRHDADRLLCRAVLSRAARRAPGARGSRRTTSALPTNIRRSATSGRSATPKAASAR